MPLVCCPAPLPPTALSCAAQPVAAVDDDLAAVQCCIQLPHLRDDVPHVYILDGVTEIGDHAFGNCAKLYNVHIPESVTKCGLYLFSGSADVALEEQQTINIFVKQSSWRQVNFGTVNTAEDSIRMGVAYVRTCLELARVTDPSDIGHIQVALQGYNYGTGYISWVWNNYGGEYTPENTQLFSDNQKAALGWSIYGDPQYVEHVLRYYHYGSTNVEFLTEGAQFAWPVPGHTNITSGFGSRWGTTHKGIDISDGGIAGVPVVASRAGTVTRADNACTHNYPKDASCGCGGGYGNRVEISHGDGTSTLYGHMVTITVSVGQTVEQGQVIGYVGCTGHSTGFHLHFEIK